MVTANRRVTPEKGQRSDGGLFVALCEGVDPAGPPGEGPGRAYGNQEQAPWQPRRPKPARMRWRRTSRAGGATSLGFAGQLRRPHRRESADDSRRASARDRIVLDECHANDRPAVARIGQGATSDAGSLCREARRVQPTTMICGRRRQAQDGARRTKSGRGAGRTPACSRERVRQGRCLRHREWESPSWRRPWRQPSTGPRAGRRPRPRGTPGPKDHSPDLMGRAGIEMMLIRHRHQRGCRRDRSRGRRRKIGVAAIGLLRVRRSRRSGVRGPRRSWRSPVCSGRDCPSGHSPDPDS